jgi:hypothetical protein
MTARRIDRPRPLPDRQLADAEHRRRPLRLLDLHRHEPHVRTLRRLARLASASAAPFSRRRTMGFTRAGGIRRTA